MLYAASHKSEAIVLLKALSVVTTSQMFENNFDVMSTHEAFILVNEIVSIDNNDDIFESSVIKHLAIDTLKHWPKVSDQFFSLSDKLMFYLEEWLNGSTPPPRCIGDTILPSGAIVQCLEHTQENCNFCDLYHRCNSGSESTRCYRQCDYPVSRYCSLHRCTEIYQDEQCRNEKSNISDNCFDHICPGCPWPNPRSKRGVNSCEIHRCQFKSTQGNKVIMCSKMQLHPHPYCEDHLCKACIVLNVVPSNQIANKGKSDYCTYHKCAYDDCSSYIYCHPNQVILSRFCKIHSCSLCIQLENHTINAVDRWIPSS